MSINDHELFGSHDPQNPETLQQEAQLHLAQAADLMRQLGGFAAVHAGQYEADRAKEGLLAAADAAEAAARHERAMAIHEQAVAFFAGLPQGVELTDFGPDKSPLKCRRSVKVGVPDIETAVLADASLLWVPTVPSNEAYPFYPVKLWRPKPTRQNRASFIRSR